MDLIINFVNKKKNQNWYSNPYSKIKIFFIILNYLFRNLQEICKILKLKTQKIENSNPNLNLWVLLGAYVWFQLTFTVLATIWSKVSIITKWLVKCCQAVIVCCFTGHLYRWQSILGENCYFIDNNIIAERACCCFIVNNISAHLTFPLKTSLKGLIFKN